MIGYSSKNKEEQKINVMMQKEITFSNSRTYTSVPKNQTKIFSNMKMKGYYQNT